MNRSINPVRSLKFAQFNFCFLTLPTDFRAWNFQLSSIFGLRKQRVPVTMQFSYWYFYTYSLSDWSKSLVELTFDEETKILPRQSSLLRAASGKAPLKGSPGSCGMPWKRGALCPFFVYSYDIWAMPWRINWVICGRLFRLSPGLQNMSSEMELSGTTWSGFTTRSKSAWLFFMLSAVFC